MTKYIRIFGAIVILGLFIIACTESQAQDQADVTVIFEGTGTGFGQVETWEASLYSGAVAGEETGGRFTDWKTVVGNLVTFALPDEVREGSSAPFSDSDGAYVRIRAREGYPTFDFVSAPFTLNDTTVTMSINTEVTETMGDSITIRFEPDGEGFGASNNWQASLYAGAVAGDETGGRFSDWRDVSDGTVIFTLPGDIRDGSEAPIDVANDTYIRLRARAEEGEAIYPTFDIVSLPFTLTDGTAYTVEVTLTTTFE